MCAGYPKSAKTEHLSQLNSKGFRGTLSLYEADLLAPGSYDEAFAGAAAVIHAGATVGFNRETPQEVYDGCFKENTHVIESVKDPAASSVLSLPRPLRLLDTLVMKVTFLPKKIGVVTILKPTKADGVNKSP